ncbi:ATP-binding cassette domain-containing protein [Euzebya sp.]|uniref:branched-chain amino acid ABC transporter ATP-binding protein/permease n=1 Tax=Euzebya sp. TaxID=1971409 RepID=UPI0035178606
MHARRRLADPIVHGPLAAVAIGVAGAVLGVASYETYLLSLALLYGIAAIGLNVPAGLFGQLSLGQGAAFAVGAYTSAILTTTLDAPVVIGLAAALVVGTAAGAVMGLPAGRLGVIGLAMVSLGLTFVVQDAARGLDITGGVGGVLGIRAPLVWGMDDAGAGELFFATLALALVVYLGASALRLSHFGRAALAIKADELGAAALGIAVYPAKVAGFALGTGVGALGGAMFSYLSTAITPDFFDVHLSVLFLIMVVLGGPGTRSGPVLGAAIVGILPILLSGHPALSSYIYGGLIIVAIRVLPRGIVSRTSVPVPDRLLPTPPPADTAAPAEDPQRPTAPADTGAQLDARGLRRSFGGVVALDDVDVTLRGGQVLGVIGPNGSGKTTLVNVLSGYYPPEAGEVRIDGTPVAVGDPVALATEGVSRTFQVPKVFGDLSVDEHLALARRGATGPPAHRERFEGLAMTFLRDTGLLDQRRATVRTLAHGTRRFLEVGMAVLRAPRLLLLDEPAAGLSAEDMALLGQLITRVAAEGVPVVLVEHHLELVHDVCDTVAVMNLGAILWSGPPAELQDSPEVREAYLA